MNTTIKSTRGYKRRNTLSKSKVFQITVEPGFSNEVVSNVDVAVRPIADFTAYMKAAGLSTKVVKFTGKAKKTEEDVYDEYIGHDLAEHRAMAKAYGYINNCFIALQEYYSGVATDFNDWQMWAKEKRDKQLELVEWNAKGRMEV